jgi:hypothetical protein
MAGEDRFPPHLSPFAKVITEVGSGAKADIDQRQGCRAQAARIRVSEWAMPMSTRFGWRPTTR